jgi:quinol monooxygenase YgiN
LTSAVVGSEAWTNRKAGEKRLQAAEMMKFMRKTSGLTIWDHKRNKEI